MSRQSEHAETFRRLHVAGHPLVLFNIWDAGSAKAVAEGGARAIATSSWAIAAAKGEVDGEHLSVATVLDTVRSITRSVDLPVSVDFESGYSKSPDGVAANVAALIQAGAIGCNLEDGVADAGRMYSVEEQAARLRAARSAALAAGLPLFINARTDAFLLNPAAKHAGLAADTLARAKVYAQSGADGLFVPGLVDASLIAQLVQASPLPVNVMIGESSPDLKSLAEAGVARISYGPGPWLQTMAALRGMATSILGR